MSFREGQRVAYVGDGGNDLKPGDRGKVLSAEAGAAHVLWMSGEQTGSIIFHDNYDLVAQSSDSSYDTDFYGSPLVTTAVRKVYDKGGSVGLLNALNEEGHLAVFTPIAEEAMSIVAARIKEEPAFIEVFNHLDSEEADGFVNLASWVLLRDAFSEEDE